MTTMRASSDLETLLQRVARRHEPVVYVTDPQRDTFVTFLVGMLTGVAVTALGVWLTLMLPVLP